MGFHDIGYRLTKQQTHAWLMDALMREEMIDEETKEPIVDKKTGEYKFIIRSMSTITKKEMIELIEKTQQYCAENLSIVIRDPDKQWQTRTKSEV